MMRRWAPPTRYTLRRITASIMKDLIDLKFCSNFSNQRFEANTKFKQVRHVEIMKLLKHKVMTMLIIKVELKKYLEALRTETKAKIEFYVLLLVFF